MPFPSARLALLASILIVSPFAATATATAADEPVESVEVAIPADADVLVTDGRGVIVGVGEVGGEVGGGTTFRLTLVEGFSGVATLTFVLNDGTFEELEVTIDEDGVAIGGHRLGDLLAGRFSRVVIGREPPGSTPLDEASDSDEADDPRPAAGPPVASPPAAGSPGGATAGRDAAGGATAGGDDDPGNGAAPTPPVGAGPQDDAPGRGRP